MKEYAEMLKNVSAINSKKDGAIVVMNKRYKSNIRNE